MKRVLAIAAVPLLFGLLTGCSSTDDKSEDAATSEISDPQVLTNFMCSADDQGTWRGKATLNNIGASPNTYTVRFSVVRKSDSSIIAYKEDEFTVQPGKSIDVALPSIVTNRSSGLECVSRVAAQPSQ